MTSDNFGHQLDFLVVMVSDTPPHYRESPKFCTCELNVGAGNGFVRMLAKLDSDGQCWIVNDPS
jgi:hypothetical protein